MRRLAVAMAAVGALTLLLEIAASEAVLTRHRAGAAIETPVDAAIVLGAQFDPDGILSWNSRRRAQNAARLLEAGKAKALIFSGAGAPPWFKSVGELMCREAAGMGAPEAQLYVDPNARTTIQNLEYAFAIADAQGFRRLALVSDAYHLTRAWALAAWLGQPGVALAAVDFKLWHWRPGALYAHLREAAAWWYNLAKVVVFSLEDRPDATAREGVVLPRSAGCASKTPGGG